MINKFFKRIHNTNSRILRFIFFLRYLVAIFFVASSLFLIIPMFFNYEKKENVIKNYLIENYNLEVSEFSNIKYKIFPLPRLELKKAKINFKNIKTNLEVANLKIYPKIFSIYNFDNFKANKIIFDDTISNLQIINFTIFIEQLFKQSNKISVNNLNLKIMNNDKSILKIENLYFSNFGYKRNNIRGKVFGKKFNLDLGNNFRSIKFKLFNSGVKAELFFDEVQNRNKKAGTFKSKVLNTNLKFNFLYDDKKLKIFNSFYRSKNLSFNNESLIDFAPYLYVKTNFEIEKLDLKILEKIDLIKIIKYRESIKKINSTNIISYKPKKFTKSFIDDLNLHIDLAYGTLNYKKKFLIAENIFNCEGNFNILEEYPLLYFNCKILINDKKELFKKLSIKTKKKNDNLEIETKGNLNILNKKINFDVILLNGNNSTMEDLKYYKDSFESILFENFFLDIFDLKKIKSFILEVI